jgi:4-hydroxy-3-methylbut-2-en-1-yl diphosphate synthase IspG/GcpE
MNKKVLTLGLMLMAGLGATAQVSLVNPVPQEVATATENAIFDAPAAWSINAAKSHQSSYIYDALMTATPEVAKKANFKVVGVYDACSFGQERAKELSDEYIGNGGSYTELIPKI